jgi:hypothetical protein
VKPCPCIDRQMRKPALVPLASAPVLLPPMAPKARADSLKVKNDSAVLVHAHGWFTQGVRLMAQWCAPSVAPSPNGDDASAGAVALGRSAPANCGGAPTPAALTVPEEAADEAELGALSSAGDVDCVKPRAPGAAAAARPVGGSMTEWNNGLGAGAALGADEEEARAGGVKEIGWFEPTGLCTRAHVHYWCAGIVLEGREGRQESQGRG